MKRCKVVPYEGKEDYIFISYSHKDVEKTNPILERLEQEGYRIWYDEAIDPGSEWPETIANHLGNAAACIGFISENYLESDNCRRELNFALKKHIPFLSILLENVEMSAGVEMQLSANQAIFKHLLPSDDVFYKKVNATSILQSSRNIPAFEETPQEAPEEPVTPAVPETPSEPDKTPMPAEEATLPDKRTKKPGKRLNKKARIILSVVLAVLIAAGALAFALNSREESGTTGADISMVNPDDKDISVSNTPVSKASLLKSSSLAGRVLFGKRTQSVYNDIGTFINRLGCVDISVEGGEINVTLLPYAIEVKGDDNFDIVRLYFYDMVGKEHIVQGKYTIEDDTLTVSPCRKVFEDAVPVSENLTFSVSIEYNRLVLVSRNKKAQLNKKVTYANESNILSGSVEGKAFGDISAISIENIDHYGDCDVRFTDGGTALDAYIEVVYNNISALMIRWSREKRMYNGNMEEMDKNKNITVYYYNTYPYGFLLINDDAVYFYQKQFDAE